MTAAHRAGRHRSRPPVRISAGRLAWAAVAIAGAALAVGQPMTAPATVPGSSADVPATTASPVPVSVAAGAPTLAAADPTRVRMPSIGVDSSLVRLGIDENRSLVPPPVFGRAGWYTGGPRPGEVGPAVIAGHVDSQDGPAVFFRLDDLEPGDEVLVDRADGTTARFVVRSTDRYAKADFPSELVYGPTPHAELRLITCGGEFDQAVGSYRDNVVVTAVLVD